MTIRRWLCRRLGHRVEILGDPESLPVDVRCRRCTMTGVARRARNDS